MAEVSTLTEIESSTFEELSAERVEAETSEGSVDSNPVDLASSSPVLVAAPFNMIRALEAAPATAPLLAVIVISVDEVSVVEAVGSVTTSVAEVAGSSTLPGDFGASGSTRALASSTLVLGVALASTESTLTVPIGFTAEPNKPGGGRALTVPESAYDLLLPTQPNVVIANRLAPVARAITPIPL